MSSNPRRSSRASALIGTMQPTSSRAVSVAAPRVSRERVIWQAGGAEEMGRGRRQVARNRPDGGQEQRGAK
jgi:hypothetical protein